MTGLGLAAGPAVLSACSRSDAAQVQQRPVQYGTSAGPTNVLLSWFTIADRLGYFEEEGVDSTVKAVTVALPLVQAGRLQSCVITPAELLPFLAENPSSDLVIGWTSVPAPFYWPVVPANSSVRRFSDLRGKTIGCSGPGALWWLIDAICTQSGMDPGDVKKATVPPGSPVISAFRSGKIDAAIYADAQVVQLNEGLGGDPIGPLRVLALPESMHKLGGTTNIYRRSDLDKNRDFYVGYQRALVKGFTFLNANVPAGVAIHLDAFPALRQPGESRRQAIDRLVKQVQPRLAVSGAPSWAAQKHPWGWTYEENLSGWQEIIPALAGKKFDVPRLYTNDLVGPAQDFDHGAIVTAAQKHHID
jgi:ABC-type nitrate/sulfonate/bicarbonate transport system substrate-binding protein